MAPRCWPSSPSSDVKRSNWCALKHIIIIVIILIFVRFFFRRVKPDKFKHVFDGPGKSAHAVIGRREIETRFPNELFGVIL